MNTTTSKLMPPEALLDVPHIKQTNENSCGAAALCMVYNYYGLTIQTEEKIWQRLKKTRELDHSQEIIYLNSFPNDIRSNGLHYIKGRAVWEDPKKIIEVLEEFLRIQVPLIVCQRWREDQLFGHFKIVIGTEKDCVWVNDPEVDEKAIRVPLDKFIADWRYYSDEVQGGWFVAILNDDNSKKLGKLPLVTFDADITNFVVSNFQFSP